MCVSCRLKTKQEEESGEIGYDWAKGRESLHFAFGGGIRRVILRDLLIDWVACWLCVLPPCAADNSVESSGSMGFRDREASHPAMHALHPIQHAHTLLGQLPASLVPARPYSLP